MRKCRGPGPLRYPEKVTVRTPGHARNSIPHVETSTSSATPRTISQCLPSSASKDMYLSTPTCPPKPRGAMTALLLLTRTPRWPQSGTQHTRQTGQQHQGQAKTGDAALAAGLVDYSAAAGRRSTTSRLHLPRLPHSRGLLTSTGTLSGRALVPTADLACLPLASPNTSTKKSLAEEEDGGGG